jgi:hypothetical protein
VPGVVADDDGARSATHAYDRLGKSGIIHSGATGRDCLPPAGCEDVSRANSG